jgi:hypothetical protein
MKKKFSKHTIMGFGFEDLAATKLVVKTDYSLDQRFER